MPLDFLLEYTWVDSETTSDAGEHTRKSRFGGGAKRMGLPAAHSSESVPQEARNLPRYPEYPGKWLESSGLGVRVASEDLGEGEVCLVLTGLLWDPMKKLIYMKGSTNCKVL